MSLNMESHKLIYHPHRVSQWLDGENIYPLELEIGLSGGCNHRCNFCAVDYLGYEPAFLDKEILLNNLSDLAIKGLKSINYSGEGEPLLHPAAPSIFNATKALGIDIGMSTNCVLLTEDMSRECLSAFTWIRVSMSGIADETYEKIHGCKKGDLQLVINNLQAAVAFKKEKNLNTTIGVQLLLLPENKDEVLEMASELKKIGVDYFSIKPYSQHPSSKNKVEVDYGELLAIEKEISAFSDNNFKVIFRASSMKKMLSVKPYARCLGLPFMVYIDAKGDMYPCIVFLGNQDMKYGNLYEKSFVDIWEGPEHERIKKIFASLDVKQACRQGCRLDEINKYLHELVHRGAHVNFI